MPGAMAATERYLPPTERHQLVSEVTACDREAAAARESGDQQKLLVQLERGLHLRRRLYVEASPEVAAACSLLCEACNGAAATMLQQENLRAARELLKRAEQVADRSDLDRAVTWNNLACYYRRTGKLRSAVIFLERALAIEDSAGNADAAQTHLNLCATLSQLNRHGDALVHAQSALIRMYEVLGPRMLVGELSLAGSVAREEVHDQITVLCIAYHNLAVEHEYLKHYDAAICAYAEGMRWASRFLGDGHQLFDILRESVDAVKAKLSPHSTAFRRVTEQLAERRPDRQLQLGHMLTPRSVAGGPSVADEILSP